MPCAEPLGEQPRHAFRRDDPDEGHDRGGARQTSQQRRAGVATRRALDRGRCDDRGRWNAVQCGRGPPRGRGNGIGRRTGAASGRGLR